MALDKFDRTPWFALFPHHSYCYKEGQLQCCLWSVKKSVRRHKRGQAMICFTLSSSSLWSISLFLELVNFYVLRTVLMRLHFWKLELRIINEWLYLSCPSIDFGPDLDFGLLLPLKSEIDASTRKADWLPPEDSWCLPKEGTKFQNAWAIAFWQRRVSLSTEWYVIHRNLKEESSNSIW